MNNLTLIFPVITICALAYFFYYYYMAMKPRAGTLEWITIDIKQSTTTPLKSHPMVRTDYLVLTAIIAISAFVNFWQLGNRVAPQSFYIFDSVLNEAIIELEGSTDIGKILCYTGTNTGEYTVEFSRDGMTWETQFTLEQKYSKTLQWLETEDENYSYDAYGPVKYIRIVADTTELRMGELAIFNTEGLLLDTNYIVNASNYIELFDEQELAPEVKAYMNSTYFDEIYYARTAYELINGMKPYENTHPPLGKLIIMSGIEMFGLTPFGWRFMGTLFGVLMLLPFYVLIKNIFGKTVIAACGTVIFNFDFMHYVQTRICTIDTYSVLFIIMMYLFIYRYMAQDYDTPLRKTLPPLILSGLSFGLGAAAKWTSVYAGAGLLILYIVHLVRRYRHCKAKGGKFSGFLIGTLAVSALSYLIVPFIIYYLSYIPYGNAYGYGSGLSSVFKSGYWEMFIGNQKHMFTYHSGLDSEHPYSSTWYMWLVNARPILYFRAYLENDTKSLFAAFNNPVVSWGGLLAIISVIISFVKKRCDSRALMIAVGYLSQLVPWIIISRIAFSYHYFTCTVFLVLALCYVLNNIWDREYGKYKPAVYGFTGAVVVVFIMFYPVLSGMVVSNQYASTFLRWFPSWPV